MKGSRFAAGVLAALMLLGSAASAVETEKVLAPPAETETAVGERDWRLLLVNPWNPLPEDFAVELAYVSGGLQVDKRILEDLNSMLADCRKAGLHPLVCSAYRTQKKQNSLYQNKISRLRAAGWGKKSAIAEAGRWVAAPGTSEHQTGLAVDIIASSYQVLNRRQEKTAEQQWLMAHCWEYGFILRYPSDKSEVTGIGYEPWHYRYVGKEASLAMKESGLCLEEYLESLEDQGGGEGLAAEKEKLLTPAEPAAAKKPAFADPEDAADMVRIAPPAEVDPVELDRPESSDSWIDPVELDRPE